MRLQHLIRTILTTAVSLSAPSRANTQEQQSPHLRHRRGLQDYHCGCQSCDDTVWQHSNADGHSCGARIAYLKGTGQSEVQACLTVSGEFPSVCGTSCDPTTCSIAATTNSAPPPPPSGESTLAADSLEGATAAFTESLPMAATSVEDFEGLGPNVYIFDDSMSPAAIQEAFDTIYYQQVNNEMGSERYSLLFRPGVYGTVGQPLDLMIGYYMDVAGLGASPRDVTIVGKIQVYNRCFAPDPYDEGQFIPTSADNGGVCFALNNFWRALSNLSISIVHAAGTDPCRSTAMFWAISQASSMRRVHIQGGDVSLMDYCTTPGFASGGFIADTKHSGGKIINGSQQQFFARNMAIEEWDGGVWNQVFLGVEGAPDDSLYPDPPFTTFETNPLSREKPYLFVQGDEYFVRVPSLQEEASGVSWDTGLTDGITLALSSFHVAKPGDSVATLNAALAARKHLLFTPGVYEVDDSILVRRPDTVILGMGLATLKATQGSIPLKILAGRGVIVSGLAFDGGDVLSPVLLQVGEKNSDLSGRAANPITLHDIYFRIGGPYIGKANICLEVNSNHVLIDHAWIWRADHGIEAFDKSKGFDGDDERWVANVGLNGAVINGNDVTATGLFVEHYQEYNLLWNGNRGRVFFFQNELPYDPPTQADWMADDGARGWAGYKVSDSVQKHELWGGGVYSYNRNDPSIVTDNGFEAPKTNGVTMNRVYTRNLSGPGSITSVINGIGGSVTATNEGPEYVVSYVA